MTDYLVGLLGTGIRHSLTPPMHVEEAARLDLDYDYRVLDLLEMDDGPGDTSEIILRARDDGYAALNITHPCKQLAIEIVDELSPEAERLEAVNLVLFRDGGIIGHNTDWTGFRSAIASGLRESPRETVVQVGAGGAGAATAYALLTMSTQQLYISDSDLSRATALAQKYQKWFPDQSVTAVSQAALGSVLADCDGVVNATPMGMAQHPGTSISIGALAPEAWVADIVYLPIETELLRVAGEAGHRILDGGRMAVGQAADSIELITGREPDRARMRTHFLALLDGATATTR